MIALQVPTTLQDSIHRPSLATTITSQVEINLVVLVVLDIPQTYQLSYHSLPSWFLNWKVIQDQPWHLLDPHTNIVQTTKVLANAAQATTVQATTVQTSTAQATTA